MTTMNISLTSELANMINEKVQSGMYNNASEVIREGLRTLIAKEKQQDMELQLIREHIMTGLTQSIKGEVSSVSVRDIIQQEKK